MSTKKTAWEGETEKERKEAEKVISGFINIVQCQLYHRALDYHASHSLHRMATHPELYEARKKSLLKSAFVSSASEDPSTHALTFQPCADAGAAAAKSAIVKGTDYKSAPYAVSVPQRIAIGKHTIHMDPNSTSMGTEFDDNPTEMESANRHPGTTMDSDCEEDEDMKIKYPEYAPTEDDSPITTVAAENLACITFVGSQGQIHAELQSAYPLQLSARIDESRKCLIFDCFEYKPYQLIDVKNVEDLSPFLPTERGWQRWNHGYHWSQVDRDDHWSDTITGTEYWGGDAQMELRGNLDRAQQQMVIYCGLTGHFAYNRCLRFRFPFENICGIRFMVDKNASSNQMTGVAGGNATAMLVLEVSQPPPKDAFATRKISSRWMKENVFELIHDWTPNEAASHASRIYMYGGENELKQTAALLAKKSERLEKLLNSTAESTNSLREGISITYDSSPTLKLDEKIQYGCRITNRKRKYSDLDDNEQTELNSDCRNSLCSDCGSVYFRGHTGLTCPECGDGEWTIDKNWDPVLKESFNGLIDKEAHFERREEEENDDNQKSTDGKSESS